MKMNSVSSENMNGNCYTEMGTYGNKNRLLHTSTQDMHTSPQQITSN